MPSLADSLNALTADGTSYVVDAPEGWTTGRSVYGGMTSALCVRACALAYPDLPPLRSAQFTFIGPASGQLRLTTQMLRQGNSATVTAVECHADGKVAARATLTYGAVRESEVDHDLVRMPQVAAVAQCEPFQDPNGEPPRGFFQYFDTRLARGGRPLSGSPVPETTAWVRLRDGKGADTLSALLAIADSLPPAAMTKFPKAGAISTMTWNVDFHHPLPGSEWYLLNSTSEQATAGYSLQAMNAWASDGTRVATGRQVVALFV